MEPVPSIPVHAREADQRVEAVAAGNRFPERALRLRHRLCLRPRGLGQVLLAAHPAISIIIFGLSLFCQGWAPGVSP